ncbi:MAG: AAA family ATPase [Campylobacterales bacterium]|nr:AAA family ATPase [Campylobacterales bacterium]
MQVEISNIEQSLLSTLLFDYNAISIVRSVLNANDFYIPSHQKIYEAIIKLYDSNLPIDEEFVKKELQGSFVTESQLLAIMTATPIAAVLTYANELKEESLKRELEKLAIDLRKHLAEQFSSTQLIIDLKEKLEQIEKHGKSDIIQLHDITTVQEKQTQYIAKSFLPFPKNYVSMVSARGGVGKTFTLIRTALEIIKEDPNQKVFAWFSEDDNGKTKKRAIDIAKQFAKINLVDIEGKFFICDDMPIDILQEVQKKLVVTEEFIKLKNQLRDFTTIILDPLLGFFSQDENANYYAKRLMLQFVSWAKKENKTIIFIHHSKKDGLGSRGAGAITDAARLVYNAFSETDENGNAIQSSYVNFKVEKDNDNVTAVANFDENKVIKLQIFPQWDYQEYKYNKFDSFTATKIDVELPDLI